MSAALGCIETTRTYWNGSNLDDILPGKDIYHICHLAESRLLADTPMGKLHQYTEGDQLLMFFVMMVRARLGIGRDTITSHEAVPTLGQIVTHLRRFICMRPGANPFSGRKAVGPSSYSSP